MSCSPSTDYAKYTEPAAAVEFSGHDLICLSHDWGGDPLSRDHLMRLFAADNRVLWVNSIGYRAPTISRKDFGRLFRKLGKACQHPQEVSQNIIALNPVAIPWHGQSWARRLNASILAKQIRRTYQRIGMRRPIVWIANPAAGILAGKLGESLSVYHCVDDYASFDGVSAGAIRRLDDDLTRRADLVFATSQSLFDAKRQLNPSTDLLRHGVDMAHFESALRNDLPTAPEVASLSRPILGFFGLLADWVDVELIAQVARAMQHASLVLIGRVATDISALESLPNVLLLGQKPYATLPAYCRAFDVGMLPFRINDLTRAANPLKLREYVAAGLPVVSTNIPEASVVPHCRVAANTTDFVRQLTAALSDSCSRAERSAAVTGESWQARYAQVCQTLSARLART